MMCDAHDRCAVEKAATTTTTTTTIIIITPTLAHSLFDYPKGVGVEIKGPKGWIHVLAEEVPHPDASADDAMMTSHVLLGLLPRGIWKVKSADVQVGARGGDDSAALALLRRAREMKRSRAPFHGDVEVRRSALGGSNCSPWQHEDGSIGLFRKI